MAPSSKSDMQRAVAAAYLTGESCEIVHPSFCDDAKAALGIVEKLGAQLDISANRIVLTPGTPSQHPVLNCGESGLSLRMFSAIASLCDDEVTLTGQGGLSVRPISMIERPLHDLGVTCHTKNGLLPVTVKGPLQAGKTVVDASVTSQFLTGLLMALPLCQGMSEIIVPKLKSKPYIEMTLHLLEAFGIEIENQQFERFIIEGEQRYKARSYNVEGDWSGAAFLLVAGAIAGSVRVENLNLHSFQADTMIIEALRMAGADVNIEKSAVEIRKNTLSGFEFDATDCPDLFPPLVVLASCCEGTSVFYGVHRLKHKESDRGMALQNEFRRLGISVELFDDRMEIQGGTINGGTVDSYNDHRIAMACAVAALRSQHGVTIRGAECVAKSYPEFFEDVKYLTVDQ